MTKPEIRDAKLLTQLKLARKSLVQCKSIIQANNKNLILADDVSINSLFDKISSEKVRLVLADDDSDDRLLFKKAVEDLPLNTNLITVNGGEELMEVLEKENGEIPTLLFLDINMPGKNGFECLAQIRNNIKFRHLSITILTTCIDPKELVFLRKNGAQRYIQKPVSFSKLKQVIYNSIRDFIFSVPAEDDFLFQY